MSDTKSLQDRSLEAEIRKVEALATQAEMNLQARRASRWNQREYLLDGTLTFETVEALFSSLDDWRRIDRDKQNKSVHIVLNCYSRGLIQPLAVHDMLRWLKLDGIDVTVEVAGSANGQAAVILAAANHRLMTERSWLNIYEVPGWVDGSTYGAETELAWLKRLQSQQRDLLSTDKLNRRQLASRSKLKPLHLDSYSAVRLGLADEVASLRTPRLITPIGIAPFEGEIDGLKDRLKAAEIRKMEAEGEIEEMNIRDRVNNASRNGVVRFINTVNTVTAAKAKADLTDAVRLSDSDITLLINSNGGSCIDGFGFIDMCKQVKESGRVLNTEVLGYAASMGGVMLQLGVKRTMGKNAWLLIHRVSNWFEGTTSEIRLTLEHSMDIQRQCFELLASRSVFTADEILDRCRTADWWLNADEALKYGFIDEIR